MKISQMTTNKAADVLLRIAEPASVIMKDSETVKMLDGMANGSENPYQFFADNIITAVSLLLKSHREETYQIIGALSDKTAEEVSQQKITDTITDIKNCADKDLIDFFGSLRG